jgi:hypothetical protein
MTTNANKQVFDTYQLWALKNLIFRTGFYSIAEAQAEAAKLGLEHYEITHKYLLLGPGESVYVK